MTFFRRGKKMKTNLAAITVAGLLWAWPAGAETTNAARVIAPDRISLYEVPLVCPAAPQIGCGSRSKPILLALEREAAVAEAWLNRAGTVMAVVWKPEAKRTKRAATLRAITKKEEFEARELSGVAKKKALKDFLSGDGWLQGRDVDRLSEEEAGIIAARLVRRIQAKVPVSNEKAEALRVEFAEIFKRRFTGAQDNDEPNLDERLLKVLQSHLDEKDAAVLRETLPRTVRPLPGEK